MQDEVLVSLHKMSENGENFQGYTKVLMHPTNIKEALRRIRFNGGRNTKGMDGMKFRDLKKMEPNKLRNIIYRRIRNKPQVEGRRVKIPKKEEGKYRTLGITNIIDRVIQQMIVNVLEPVTEPFMSSNSFGFRKGKSLHHAIAVVSNCYEMGWDETYSLDIEKCFDNIPLEKSIERLEEDFKIKDKHFLDIIRWAMEVNYDGEKYNGIGLAQGNILSPLLTNVTLNRVDQQLDNLYYNIPMNYKKNFSRNPLRYNKDGMYRVKGVRYADDLTIFAKTKEGLKVAKEIVNKELKEIGLRVNPNKSKEFNINGNSLEFLGYEILTSRKSAKKTACIRKVNYQKYIKALVPHLKEYKKSGNMLEIKKFFSKLYGYLNFMRLVSNINPFMEKLYEQLYRYVPSDRIEGKVHFRFGKGLETVHVQMYEIWKSAKTPVKKYLMSNENWTPKIGEDEYDNDWFYTEVGRLRRTTLQSISWISLLRQQKGKDYLIRGKSLQQLGETEIHHRVPISKGGDDEYRNLVLLSKVSHTLIHCSEDKLEERIKSIEETYECTVKKRKLEEYRNLVKD